MWMVGHRKLKNRVHKVLAFDFLMTCIMYIRSYQTLNKCALLVLHKGGIVGFGPIPPKEGTFLYTFPFFSFPTSRTFDKWNPPPKPTILFLYWQINENYTNKIPKRGLIVSKEIKNAGQILSMYQFLGEKEVMIMSQKELYEESLSFSLHLKQVEEACQDTCLLVILHAILLHVVLKRLISLTSHPLPMPHC